MAVFFEYLRNITYYLLFAALAAHLAPGGKYRKYVLLVAGLVMVCLLLRPLGALAKGGIPVTDLFARLVPAPAAQNEDGAGFEAAYEAWRYEAVETAFAGQLSSQLASLLALHQFTLIEAAFEYTEDFSALESVTAKVAAGGPPASRPFIYIEPVRIPGAALAAPDTEDPAAEEVKKLISDFYRLPLPHIHIEIMRE